MKYIFVAGAPGSKWSSVVKNIYRSTDVDVSDYAESRTYYHAASGSRQLMHLGAYFDPGMEFGAWFDRLDQHSPAECEVEFDRPFSSTGVRIIKSHVFAHHIDYLKTHWPDLPVVLVLRDNDACLGWWVRCGQFGITYPLYHQYYQNLDHMAAEIDRQNSDIVAAWNKYQGHCPDDNYQLAELCKIAPPADKQYYQNYSDADISIKVI